MELKDIQTYLDKYIKNFLPFKDDKPYQGLVNVLRNDFFPEIYNHIPSKLKEFVEDQKLNINLYDILLLSIGYPEHLVNSLRMSQKRIVVRNLMDYAQYSGTVKFVQKVCKSFKEGFNVYELYVDFRLKREEEDDKFQNDWIFVPRPIFEEYPQGYRILNYNKIYNGTPTYFLSKIHLELLRQNRAIALPFKSNLYLLDLEKRITVSDMDQLVSLTAFQYFKDYRFHLSIFGQAFQITVSELYQLWYYILFSYTGKVASPDLGKEAKLILFNLNLPEFPITLEPGNVNSIDVVVKEYEALPIEKRPIDSFYQKYFINNFQTNTVTGSFNLNDFKKRIKSILDDQLISLVDKTLETQTTSQDVLDFLQTLLDSLKLYVAESNHPLMQKYGEHLIAIFPLLLTDPTKTATYKLIHEFKPYHTQLIAQSGHRIISKSKFNSITIDSNVRYVVHQEANTAPVISIDNRISQSIETGFFKFFNDNTIETDFNGIGRFNPGDQIFSRDISTNIFPMDHARTITEIIKISEDKFHIKLDKSYTGPIGIFPRAYKLNPIPIDQLIVLEKGGYFSFTNIGYANIVGTTEEGLSKFNIGDYIYSPADTPAYAVKIIQKDYNALAFVLDTAYEGSAGSWPEAKRYRPAF